MAGSRRRALLLALTLTLALGLAGPGGTAWATPPPVLELAVEEGPGGGTELPGPEPDFQNTFAPEEFETPPTWWIGVILAAVTVLSIAGLGLGYLLLVRRRDES